MPCQEVKRRGQKGGQVANGEVRFLVPNCLQKFTLPAKNVSSEYTAYVDLWLKEPIYTCIDTTHWRQQLHCQKKKKATWCSLNADCSDPHFFFAKLCDVIRRSCFFISPVFNKQKMSFLYLTLMWQTVCFVISAKDIKCLFWYKLGGVRLAGRMRKQERDVKGREMSIRRRVFIRASCLHLTNSNHNNHNHNLQRAFQAVGVSIWCDWAMLQLGFIYFRK